MPHLEQPAPHCILVVIRVSGLEASAALRERLVRCGKTKLDVAFHLAGMRRRVEASELDGALRPGRVEIECVVSRAVEQERALVV